MEYVKIYGWGAEKANCNKKPVKRTISLKVETFDSESACGYKQITTFYSDFSIADRFGVAAVRDTFKRAFNEWRSNYKYLTELVMVLNWKLAIWYDRKNEALANVYDELWRTADAYAMDNLTGEEMDYFLEKTD